MFSSQANSIAFQGYSKFIVTVDPFLFQYCIFCIYIVETVLVLNYTLYFYRWTLTNQQRWYNVKSKRTVIENPTTRTCLNRERAHSIRMYVP